MRRPPIYWRAVLLGGWTVLFSGAVIVRVWVFKAGAFDLGVFVEGFRWVMGHGPFSKIPMLGVGFLADHFSPAVLPLAPLAVGRLGPYLLVTIQVVAVGAAGWLFAGFADHIGRRGAWYGAALVTTPTVLFGLANDFHPSMLAGPFLVIFFHGLVNGGQRPILIGGLIAALVREDIAYLVLLGVMLHWRPRRAESMVGLTALSSMTIAHVTGVGDWFTRSGTQYLVISESQPMAMLAELWDGGRVLGLAAMIVIPWVVVGRVSGRMALVAAGFCFPLFVLDLPQLETIGYHYYAPVAYPLAISALYGGSRSWMSSRVRWAILGAVLLIGPTGLGLGGRQPPVWWYVRYGVEHREEIRGLHEWITGLPVSGNISAAHWVFPHVVGTDSMRYWPSPFADVVLKRISSVPIIEAEPWVVIGDVIAPTGACPETGTAVTAVNTEGFEVMDTSPDGCYVWMSRP